MEDSQEILVSLYVCPKCGNMLSPHEVEQESKVCGCYIRPSQYVIVRDESEQK